MQGKIAACHVEVVTSLAQVEAAEWDLCANPDGVPYNPFSSYAFMSALQDSGSVSAKTGWATAHIAMRDDNARLGAVLPCYLKGHSYGEYVFDHAWAQAYERAGGRYYPKLQTAVPFTPATGRRFLIGQGVPVAGAQEVLMEAAIQLARANRASSWHVTFATGPEWEALGALGLLQRTDTQYHWFNNGYATFDDFLATLASRKRKTVRKEREQARASGVEIEMLTGDAIFECHWDAFFAFYLDTSRRKWGSPYLNRKFFRLIGERMADRVLLVMGKRDGVYVAGALNFIGGDALYGRYWGCVESHSFLHFEACYYRAIDYAIANRLARVEAGAQGEHKIARGYVPSMTYSLHYLADPGLASAVSNFLVREREAVIQEQTALAELAPYRKGE